MNMDPAAKAAGVPLHAKEAPQNGLKGLKHWRHDLLAGFVVSLVSLPLSSGIAIASGAPPIYGIISSIIAGLVFPFIGGSFVTISGPAAGLAPALMATMIALGGAGDADHVGAGYPMLLAVIFIAGLGQVVMAKLNLARFAAVFPAAAVEGMLGAIGVLILVKALPLFFGFLGTTHAHGFLEYLAEVPHWWAEGDRSALIIGAVTLAIMLAANSALAKRWSLFAKVPPHLFGVAFAVPAAMLMGLKERDARFLITVPENPLSGLSLPDFGGLFTSPELWWAAAVGVMTLMLIDGVESLATAQAIDRIDPFKRQSIPDRLLLSMGLSNMLSSLVGGLTVIPGGVKSKTNIEAGGRTLWANFVNAMFLLVFLFLAPGLVAMLPKAALGAILVYTGWKMMHPSIVRGLATVGKEQVLVYLVTITVTLLTDLLIGVFVGTLVKLLVVAWMRRQGLLTAKTPAGPVQVLKELFADPVSSVEELEDGAHVLHVAHPVVSFNAFRLFERVSQERAAGHQVHIVIEPSSGLVDHTAMEGLHRVEHELEGVSVDGLQGLQPRGKHPASVRSGVKLAG
jgi:MFS superfamily sulfate permease-like transporter